MKSPVRPLRFVLPLLALWGGVVAAQPRGGPPGRGDGGMPPGRGGGFEQQGPQRFQGQQGGLGLPPQQGPQESNGPRERRLQWVSDQREQGGGPPAERPRMSPEERRQLRQEIHDAGRELYPPRRGPRGDRPPGRND